MVAHVDAEAVLSQARALSVDAVDAVVVVYSHLVLQQLCAVMTDVATHGAAHDWSFTK